MRYKGFMIILMLAVFALSVAGVCASDAATALESSADDSVIEVEDVQAMGQDENEEIVSEGNAGTFSQLQDNINRNYGSTLKLDKDYECEDGFSTDGISITDSITIDGRGHAIDAKGKSSIFNINSNNVIIKNIIFKNGKSGNGGAISFNQPVTGTVINCTFTNNTGNNGGAIYHGSAINCTFDGNTARGFGGAIFLGSALNCIFNGNTGHSSGGAMTGDSAVNCTFNANTAPNGWGGAMDAGAAVNCTFNANTAKMGDAMHAVAYINCIGQEEQYIDCKVLSLEFNMEDFISTYHSNDGLKINLVSQYNNTVPFIDVDVIIYDGDVVIKRCSCLSGDSLDLDLAAGNYTAQLIVTYPGLTVDSKNISLIINKAATKIEVSPAQITTTYNANNYLVITLTDSNGNRLAGEKITVTFNGAKTYATDKNGQVKVSTKGLIPKAYTAKIAFSGNANYINSAKDVKVTVKKAKPKITAKAKSFKKSLKIKKYAVTLKAGKSPVKKVKVTIKIGKKTYTAKTNSKGKATFKIKKLSKKGTYKSKVTFKGDKCYKKVTKTVKIKVK